MCLAGRTSCSQQNSDCLRLGLVTTLINFTHNLTFQSRTVQCSLDVVTRERERETSTDIEGSWLWLDSRHGGHGGSQERNRTDKKFHQGKMRWSKDKICGFESIHYFLKIAFIRTKEKMALIWHDRPFCPDPGLLLAETSLKSDNDS